LLLGGRLCAIRILQVGYSILSGSFGNSLVEVGGVAVAVEDPVLFGSLKVDFFVFG
jgi:hypothetical protein